LRIRSVGPFLLHRLPKGRWFKPSEGRRPHIQSETHQKYYGTPGFLASSPRAPHPRFRNSRALLHGPLLLVCGFEKGLWLRWDRAQCGLPAKKFR